VNDGDMPPADEGTTGKWDWFTQRPDNLAHQEDRGRNQEYVIDLNLT